MATLQGQTCLITGAAGGIGTALAHALADSGVNLALADINLEAAQTLAQAVASPEQTITAHAVDVRDPVAIERLVSEVETKHGKLNILICGAGVTTYGRFIDHTADDIDWLFDINLRGLIHTCRACLPLLRKTRGSHIVNISSMNALFGVPTMLAYASSKWGVRGFSHGLRIELAPLGIGVTTVLPGAVATQLIQAGRSHDDEAVSKLAPLIERHALRPERLAHAIEKAIRSNRAEIVVGLDAKIVWWSMRWIPWLIPWLVSLSYSRMEKSRDPQDPT